MAGSHSNNDPPIDERIDAPGVPGRLHRLRPLRVLVVSPDARFRAVCSMLIARRGCDTVRALDAERLAELIGRERIDVVVIDGDVQWAELSVARASLEGFSPPAGIVAVAEREGCTSSGRRQLAKWGSFERLFAAIERAEQRRGALRVLPAATWPASDRRTGGGV